MNTPAPRATPPPASAPAPTATPSPLPTATATATPAGLVSVPLAQCQAPVPPNPPSGFNVAGEECLELQVTMGPANRVWVEAQRRLGTHFACAGAWVGIGFRALNPQGAVIQIGWTHQGVDEITGTGIQGQATGYCGTFWVQQPSASVVTVHVRYRLAGP